MIRKFTVLNVIDNSGVKKCQCIEVYKNSGGSKAYVGDIILVAIKKTTSDSKIKKGKKSKAIIVRTKNSLVRPCGTKVTFGENAVVLIDDEKNPIGNRIPFLIDKNIKLKGYQKIIALSKGEI